MKVLFIITSVEAGAWLSEITHPYWHLAERGVEVDFASLRGGKIGWTPWSDPGAKESMEPGDLVSKGFISDRSLMARLEKTSVLVKVDLSGYDAVHVAGGGGGRARGLCQLACQLSWFRVTQWSTTETRL